MTRPGRRRYQADWPVRLPRTRRRLSRTFLLLAIGIVVSVIATAVLTRDDDEPTDDVAPPLAAAGQLELRGDGWYLRDADRLPLVTVEQVIDGDTLEVRAAQTPLRVRIFGVDAPERGERCAAEATERLRMLAGTQVRLLADQRQQDPFGRELRYLATQNGRSIDATLVADGYARAWPEDGALRAALLSIEQEARGAQRGCLWQSR